ncbi:hypothetical protein A176_003809 [Myxococcus hansupus]|uniref:Uncharacterized protein n=1 Tax=Pseudomyxococcus hansupus TaxID=1297742 RepID=A0A0H4XFD0_9BACT|nr:hypothetical protein A176_003809 [Myxococcus hansupus]
MGRDKFHHVVVGEMPPQNIAAFRVALAELKRLEERIEECRVFGCEVTEEIGKDFDDIKVHKKKKDFLRYMDRHGRHFPNLVAWVANLK